MKSNIKKQVKHRFKMITAMQELSTLAKELKNKFVNLKLEKSPNSEFECATIFSSKVLEIITSNNQFFKITEL